MRTDLVGRYHPADPQGTENPGLLTIACMNLIAFKGMQIIFPRKRVPLEDFFSYVPGDEYIMIPVRASHPESASRTVLRTGGFAEDSTKRPSLFLLLIDILLSSMDQLNMSVWLA